MTTITQESLDRVAAIKRGELVAEVRRIERAAIDRAKELCQIGMFTKAVVEFEQVYLPALDDAAGKVARHDAGQRKGWRPSRSVVCAARRAAEVAE